MVDRPAATAEKRDRYGRGAGGGSRRDLKLGNGIKTGVFLHGWFGAWAAYIIDSDEKNSALSNIA